MACCKSFVIAYGQVRPGVPEETDRKTARQGAPSYLWPLGTVLTSVMRPWIESNCLLQDGKGNTSASRLTSKDEHLTDENKHTTH